MANIYPILNGERLVSKRLELDDLSDSDLIQMTRFPRHAVIELCDMMTNELSPSTSQSNAIPVETQLLAALQFFASGSFQWMVGRSCGLSQSAVSHCINNVTEALIQMAPRFITYPTDEITLRKIKQSFYAFANFPNVIGLIGQLVLNGSFSTIIR